MRTARRFFCVVLLIAGCDRTSQEVATQKQGLTEAVVPQAAPVGRLAGATPATPVAPVAAGAPAAEARGLLGPSGTLGIEVYRARRKKLMDLVGKAGVLIENHESWDGAREDSDFYWLTGLDEDGASLYLEPQAPRWKEILFVEALDVEGDRWSGERALLPSKAMEVASGIARVQRDRLVPSTLRSEERRVGKECRL